MMRLLWLLAWCSHAIDTKTWTVTIDEELPVGRNIVDLRHELNYSPERIFSLISASEIFAVSARGVLSTKGRVDFEALCVNSRDVCRVELEVGVLPQEYYERIQLTLLITNKNDNLHFFTQPQYELSISENYPTNNRFDISALSAIDSDANEELTYRLSSNQDHFKVEQAGARLFLVANAKLDRESKAEYESRLIATDRDGQAVETNVVIKLRDENDNAPKFTQPPKEVDFDEAKPTGSLIARVYAEDADHGHNAELEYAIIGCEPPVAKNFIEIEKYSGRIVSTKSLKGAQLERVKLTIVCSDNGVPSLSAEQLVTVNIIQIEDPPQIVLTPVFGNPDDASASMVMENSKKGTFVSWLRITNRKSSDDLTIMLSPAEYFKLNSDVIVTTRAFDREKKAMFNLKVTVCETTRRIHRCAKSEQTVYVGDVNDNSPIMSREHISMNLREDTPTAQSLLRVRAADADSTFGVLSYSLEQNEDGVYRIDAKTGEIFLARPIDYERRNKYEFIARATDPDGKSAATVVNVSIINVNDNRPRFNLESNQIQISNKHNVNEPVLVINATDADGVEPVMKIGPSDSFVLVKNKLYLTANLTSSFSKEVQLIVIDGDDPTSIYTELITVSIARGLGPIIGGVIGAIIIIMLILLVVIKLCAERKYRIYQRGQGATMKQQVEQHHPHHDKTDRSNRDYHTIDYQSYHIAESGSDYAKLSIRQQHKHNDGRDSGRGDSDSNPDTLTDWCQPECLTLGHSDSCWLPANNQRYSGQFAVEVGPDTPKHRLEVVVPQAPTSTQMPICDRTSDYSSYNSAGENSNQQSHVIDNRLSQILSSDVIV